VSLPDLGPLVRFDERLREVPVEAEVVEAALSEALSALDAAKEGDDQQSLLTYAGNAARILGRADESISLFRRALDSADGERGVAARVRLGEAYRCADRPEEAVSELEQALIDARRTGAYVDFALQHLGKALIDAGEPEQAVTLLEEALELRRRRHDAELVESTELALVRARSRVSETRGSPT
jgi:tetratricopeptide (TPR) repeat protein